MGRFYFQLVFFLSLVGHFPAFALAPNGSAPARTSACPRLLAALWSFFETPGSPGVPYPYHFLHGNSLLMGVPPGISLDGKDILAYFVQDLFERPDWFAWIRTLNWPLRRQLGTVEGIERYLDVVGKSVAVSVKPLPNPRFKDRRTLSVEVRSQGDRQVVMLFDEQIMGGMKLYICRELFWTAVSDEDPGQPEEELPDLPQPTLELSPL